MDAVAYSHADKQKQRIEKFIENPDSVSGVLTVPSTIAVGETITIPVGRTAVLPNVAVDGTLVVDGDVFIPSGSSLTNTKVELSNSGFTTTLQSGTLAGDVGLTLPSVTGTLTNDADVPTKGYMAYGGTANAVTLTTLYGSPITAYEIGQQFRFRATTTNTGAMTINVDGLGAKTVRDIRNIATVAGEIRTDVDTVVTYDGTNFIADRQIESGSNANGEYVKFADGTLTCYYNFIVTPTSYSASGQLFKSDAFTWNFPYVFFGPAYSVVWSGGSLNYVSTVNSSAPSSSVQNFVIKADTATLHPLRIHGVAKGIWK